jgi:hypothetical protein
MKKLTTNLMLATAALVVAAGAASAQTQALMTAQIPFEFRAGNQVMAPGTYQIDRLQSATAQPVFRLSNAHSGGSIMLLPQAPVDPRKQWAEGEPKLLFACTSGSCSLAQIWSGSESYAYKFRAPKPGQGETAVLREIPLQSGKGE